MFIELEEEEMILPKNIVPVAPAFKSVSSLIINHYVKDGILVKRLEALGREVIIFHGNTNEIANRYTTDFDVINALFITFTPKTPEDYICLIGVDGIDFYAIADGMFCSLALPFKISQAHPTNFGLILERSSLPGEFGNPPGAAQLFSLTHPYNEILPILCKFKGDSQCHYTFRDRRIGVVPKDVGANWSAAYSGPTDLVMCYDHDERTNHIFMVRKCTKEERMAAKSDLGVLNSSALMHTPSTVQSFYSPNFFNRRFADNRLATIGLMNAQMSQQQSPAVNSIPFYSNSRQQMTTTNSITSMASSSAGFLPLPSKVVTPFRRITRSMAAAEKMAFTNTLSGGASLPSTGAEKSPSFHRSLEHNATINRMRLKQKLAMAASTGTNSANNIFHTPRHGTSFSMVDMDDLLSFGGREEDEEPPSSLDMAVEFCLEWLWSEPLPIEDQSLRSGSSSSVGTERVANKLETLRVSSASSSHSDEAATNKTEAPMNRMASTFFITQPAFARSERCIIFHIPSDRRIRVLSMTLLAAAKPMESPNPPVVVENGTNFIRANAAIPFLHSPFFMVLDNFSFSDSLSTASSLSLYTGQFKVANLALNIGMASVLRLLPGGLGPDGHNLFQIRVFAERDDDLLADGAFHAPETNAFAYDLQLGFSTKLASRCLRAVCAWVGSTRQLQFLARLYGSNPWRIVAAAQQIPFIDEVPVECVEMGLLFEQFYAEYGYNQEEMPFNQLLDRIRDQLNNGGRIPLDGGEGEEECSAKKRTRLDEMDILKNDKFWHQLKLDQQIASEAVERLDNLRTIKFVNERLMETIRRIMREERRIRAPKFPTEAQTKKSATDSPPHKWVTAPKWTGDLRVYNVQQMLDSSAPILIPSKALGPSFNEVQQREQHEHFLLTVALRTVTRPFGRAALNMRTRHGFEDEKKGEEVDEDGMDPQMGVRPICLNGRVHPGWHQVDFPLNDSNPSHKAAMDWANFYNALAHGLSYCGGFPLRLFSATTREESLPSSTKAGLLLAAGLTGTIRSAMNLYDIHTLLTQNDRYLVIALLIGCSAADRGTSEVHIYKMIAAHLPFLLQPTLCEFRIELVIQTAALISLGLLFAETANHRVSSQLLNQMALEVPCESDQAFERYSFVLAAGMAIGLINLGKGKEITDTEIPISLWPSLKDRLIKMLNGDERRLAYLNYDRVQCPGMRIGNGTACCSLLRRYTPGGGADGGGGVTADNVANGGGQQGGGGASASSAAAANQSFARANARDLSGIGHPSSNHVRELPTLNVHLTAPAAAIALGLMYMRTGDAYIREKLAIKDTFYEIDKNRPDMLMIRTLCRCLVDFDDVKCTREWAEEQIPEIVRKYTRHYLEARSKEDLWWGDFIDIGTVAKAYLYCLTGACFAVALRYASTCETHALHLIHHLYEILEEKVTSTNPEFSWAGMTSKAGRNCVRACLNVCALCMALVMAGSGDLQTTRILRKIRNSLPDTTPGGIPPKDTSVHSAHVCLNMSLGLLYLGYGRYALSNSNFALASLVLSLFPLFPHSITDNRCYFQPMRFLWALAIKPNASLQSAKGSLRETKSAKSQQKPPHLQKREEEIVDCQRCGRLKITTNASYIF